jgi:hypothetical protein
MPNVLIYLLMVYLLTLPVAQTVWGRSSVLEHQDVDTDLDWKLHGNSPRLRLETEMEL